MSSTWELKEKSTGGLTTTVEGDTWKDAQREVFRKLIREVGLPGFRLGQTLEKLVRKQTSSQNILMEAIDEVVGNALSAGIKEYDLWMISRPALNIKSINEDRVTFKFNAIVKPEVGLGACKGLDITRKVVEISDADTEEEITRLQERFVSLVVKEEGKVEDGDTAVVDFEGFKKGIAFEGGRGEAYPPAIGSGNFISGFEEQVPDVGIEEAKDINVTFLEDYQAEELAGQSAAFKMIVYRIKSRILPEVDDELVKQTRIEDVKTPGAFREYSRKNLEESKENQTEQKLENRILTAVTENTEVKIPQIMIEEETDSLVRDFEQRLQPQGFGLEQFKQVTGQTDEMIYEEMGKDAFNKVKIRLALEAIAAEERIEINEEGVSNELEGIANMYQMPVEQVKQLISNDAVSYDLRVREALKLIKGATGRQSCCKRR